MMESEPFRGLIFHCLVSILFFVFPLPNAAGEISGQPCPQLDEQDGYLDDIQHYRDWYCEDLLLPEVAGTDFNVRLRWNRPDLNSRATVLWLGSGNGMRPFADFDKGIAHASDPRPIRTRLDENEQIRSIEIQFLNPVENNNDPEVSGGYWATPRQGYLKAAIAYQQVVDFLHQPDVGLVQGDWLTQVGFSNGATILAFALAYLDANRYHSHMVFISGPFAVDILKECHAPDFFAYTGIRNDFPDVLPGSEIRRLLSAWNGWNDCADIWFTDFRRSLLGFLAQRSFPDTEIDVIVGTHDGFGKWLLNSNARWFAAISAYKKFHYSNDDVPHDVFGSHPGTDTLLFNRIRRPPDAKIFSWNNSVR
jgi:hypothetical protein